MTTANDLITNSARTLGYLGRTESLSAGDANDGLTCLNRLLDSWSNEFLMSYVTVQQSFPLVAGQQAYTIGTGGNINTTRPQDIIQAFLRDSNNNDYPITIVPQDVWNNIGLKSITSQIPDTLFYYSSYPLGIIYVFPVPLISYTIFFDASLDQVDPGSLNTTISMPPGYERAYTLNLALEMMNAGFPCLLDAGRLAWLLESAKEAKANVKRTNIKEVLASFDPYITARSNATYNIYNDGNPRSQ